MGIDVTLYITFLLLVWGAVLLSYVMHGEPKGEWLFTHLVWVTLAVVSTFWSTVIFVIGHFAMKYW
jgi:hypothetical protein